MRIKIPRSGPCTDWLEHKLDPETLQKLHEGRLKLNIIEDGFFDPSLLEEKTDSGDVKD